MPQNVTKAEFTARKIFVDEQIDAINKQLQLLRSPPQAIFIDEINQAKVFLGSRIDQLAQQLAVFRDQLKIEEDGSQIALLRDNLEDQVGGLSRQLASLRDQLTQGIESVQDGSVNAAFQQTVSDQIDNINKRVAEIQTTPDEPDARFEIISASVNDKITNINYQLAQLRQTNLQEVQLRELEIFKTTVQEQINSINMQIQQIRQLIQELNDTVFNITDIDLTPIINDLQIYINEQIANIIVQPGNILASSFPLSITTAGDAWTGTEYNGGISTTSKVFTELLVTSVTTRHSARPTDFILNITSINNGNFTWELESMAKVLNAELTVMYTWSR